MQYLEKNIAIFVRHLQLSVATEDNGTLYVVFNNRWMAIVKI